LYKNFLKRSIISVENQINFKNNAAFKRDFYNFLDLYESEITAMREVLKTKFVGNENDYFKNEIKYLKAFNIKFNDYIENEEIYVFTLSPSFIIKSFTSFESFKVKNEFEIEDENLMVFESDKVVNRISKDIKIFFIWLEIFYSKRTASLKKINYNPAVLRKVFLS
jgi:hypothetical protein